MFTSDDFGTIADNEDDLSEDIYSIGDFDSEYDTALVDSDGDGIYETAIQGFDTDDDGQIDTWEMTIDSDNDGQIDTWGMATDLDNDGFADQTSFMEGIDSDGDEQIDTLAFASDLDNDGQFDEFSVAQGLDNDNNGHIDTVEITMDLDNNGVVDAVATYEVEETGVADGYAWEDSEAYSEVNSEDWGEYYSDDSNQYAEAVESDDSESELNSESEADSFDDDDDDFDDDDPFNAELEEPEAIADEEDIPDEYQNNNNDNDNDIVGDPENDLDDWQQQTYEDSCSVVAEQSILNELTGENFSEDDLRQEAIDNGWLTPGGGTTIDSVGSLLEAHGIDVEQKTGCSFDDVAEQLEQGQKVMIAVDSDEIWNPEGVDDDDFVSANQGIPEQGANHVVEVLGFDNSDPDNPMVILQDPGHPEGQEMTVSLEQCQDAWSDSNQYMVHTTGNAVQENESADLDFGGRVIGLLGDYYDYDDPVEYNTSMGDYYSDHAALSDYQGFDSSTESSIATGYYEDAAWYAEHGY